jgi:pimeloyl-ACP methyl ester carboxylesterase
MRKILLALILLLLAAAFLPPVAADLFGWSSVSQHLPPHGRTVDIGGGRRLHLRETGTGSPIVLVPGLPSTAADWAELPEKLAAQDHRVIAYDRVGYGYSSRPDPDAKDEPDHYTLESNTADLRDLLDTLSIDRAALVGWSYGGEIVQTFARQSPERVTHLVLVGSVGPGWQSDASQSDWLTATLSSRFGEAILDWIGSIPPLSRKLTHDVLIEAFSGERDMPEGWTDYTRAYLALPGTLRALVQEEQRNRPHSLHPEQLTMPSLVIHGTDDRLVDYGVGENLHQRLPNSRLETVFAGSHMLPVTHSDLLADKIHGLVGPGYILDLEAPAEAPLEAPLEAPSEAPSEVPSSED